MSVGKRAAGLVVFRLGEKDIEYLLLKASYPPYHWTPPKGHVVPGETDLLTTALRETQEEAGFTKEDLSIKDYKCTIEYSVKGKPKEVNYWPAKLTSKKEVVLSDEHTAFVWANCSSAINLIGYPSTGDIITKIQKYLTEGNK